MLGVFRNTLTAYDKYPVRNCVNFSSLIQLELSLKPTIFSNFVVPFSESASNFKHFEKKDDRHTYFISKIREWEKFGWTTL